MDAESLIAPAEEDVEADEEVVINEGEDVEVEPMKIAKDPGQPTRRQVEEHRKFHIPFILSLPVSLKRSKPIQWCLPSVKT